MKVPFPAPQAKVLKRAVLFVCGLVAAQVVPLPAQVAYTWTSGNILSGVITPSGATTFAANDTLAIVSAANHDIAGNTVVNHGTVNWSAGTIRGGASFTNNGQFNDAATASFNADFGGWTFQNSAGATYTKSSGTTTVSVPFANSGTLLVTGGTLNLDAGGTFSSGSTAGSSGSGVLQLTGGTLTLSGTVATNNLVLNGGTVSGTHTVTGLISWLAGTLNSSGITTIASGSNLTISGSGNRDFASHSIVNNGTIAWSGGVLRSGSGGNITNQAAFNDSATAEMNNDYGGATSTFINAASGLYTKSAGTTVFSVPFINYGTVTVSGGTLSLGNGGTFHDGSIIGSTGSGVAQLTGGVLTAGGSAGFTANNFILNGGQVSGNVTFLGTTQWVAGNLNTPGTATVGAGATLAIANAANHDFAGHAIVNLGTVTWSNGALRSGSGGTLTNQATWSDSGSGLVMNNDYGGATSTFINAVSGNYTKTAGSTTFQVPLLNYGTIAVSGGTLNLASGGTFYDGSVIGSSGSGLVQLTGGTLTASGTTGFTAGGFRLAAGSVSGDTIFRGSTEWAGSTFNTSGTATIASGASLTLINATNHDFAGHAIVNQGTVNWTSGNLRSGSGGTFTNQALVIDTAGGAEFNNDYGGATASFVNSPTGTYQKTSGATTFSTGTFVNQGTISVTGGALYLNNSVFSSGSTVGSSGPGTVSLIGGTLAASGTITAQNFLFNGGEITGTQTFQGTLSWLSGNLNNTGSTTIGPAATLTIANAVNHDFNGHAIVNQGTVNWTFGPLRSGGGGTITNSGTWNDSAFGVTINSDYGGALPQFINTSSGVYRKTSGSTTISVPVTNQGRFEISGGALAVTSNFTSTGTVDVGSGATFTASQPLSTPAGAVLRGGGQVTAPSFGLAGALQPGTQGTAGLLTLNGATTFLAGATVAFDLGGTSSATGYDRLEVNGTLALGGNLSVGFINGFNSSVTGNMTFDLVGATSLSGSFANVVNGATLLTSDGFGMFRVNYGSLSAFSANSVVLSNFVAVPEPSTWALMLSGSAAVALSLRRRLFRRR